MFSLQWTKSFNSLNKLSALNCETRVTFKILRRLLHQQGRAFQNLLVYLPQDFSRAEPMFTSIRMGKNRQWMKDEVDTWTVIHQMDGIVGESLIEVWLNDNDAQQLLNTVTIICSTNKGRAFQSWMSLPQDLSRAEPMTTSIRMGKNRNERKMR